MAVALIVPTASIAYGYYQKINSPANNNPFDYIPGNSGMVATVHKNNSLFYIYNDNNSYGVIANISYNIVPSNNSTIFAPAGNGTSGNLSQNVTVKTLIYDKMEVYEVKNVNLRAILKNTANINLGSLLVNNTTNVFVYTISNKYVVLGQENAINESISAHMKNHGAMKLQAYLNLNDNESIYYNLTGLSGPAISAKFLTVNVTQNHSLVNIYFSRQIMPMELKLLKTALANANYSAFGNLSSNLSHPQISAHNNVLTLKYNITPNRTGAVFKTLNIKT